MIYKNSKKCPYCGGNLKHYDYVNRKIKEVAKWQKYCNRCDYYQKKCLKIEEYYEYLKTHQLEKEL